MILGQIGEYRELSLEEQREYFGQQCRDAQALERLEADQRDTTTIAGKFAKVLGCLEDALNWLGQVNEQYDPEQYADDIRLVNDYGLPPCNPAMDFWLQAALAEGALKGILDKLQGVEPLAPKEKEVAP